MTQLIKEYEKLKKQYNLPSYKELDDEFELLYFTPVIEIRFISRFIRRRIVDKLRLHVNFFHGIINQNPSNLISLQENKFFSQEDKDKITDLIREMVILDNNSTLLDLNSDEKSNAEFIKYSFKKWQIIKKSINKYYIQLNKGWQSNIKEESKEHYFG